MRPAACLVGLHAWDSCQCARCGRQRDRGHDWKYCRCALCGVQRNTGHDWEGRCRCRVCGATRDSHHDLGERCLCRTCNSTAHDFASVDSSQHECRRCGLLEEHNLVRTVRWEDVGGWDSVGPWGESENEYETCRKCGYEQLVGFTGRILG